MNDALKMQISAFVDGELPENEAQLLLKRLGQDAGLRREVDRYYAIGRLLRGERSLPGMDTLRERVSGALANEPQPAAAATAIRWQRPAAGVAIAASVALLALVGLQQINVPSESAALNAASAGVAIDPATGYTEPAASDVMSDQPSEMLMQYYLSHGETSGDLGANGILSRLVTLELRGGELVEVLPATERLATDREDVDNRAAPDTERE